MNTFAERLLLLRGKTKQGDFAKTLEINPNTLRSYENGTALPNQKLLEAICVKFSVSSDWLLLGRGPMRPGEETPAAQAPSSTPQETGSIAALEARVAVMGEVLKAKEEALRAKEELLKAKDETLAAYKQALDTMRELALMGGTTTTGAPPCAPPAPSPNHASK